MALPMTLFDSFFWSVSDAGELLFLICRLLFEYLQKTYKAFYNNVQDAIIEVRRTKFKRIPAS